MEKAYKTSRSAVSPARALMEETAQRIPQRIPPQLDDDRRLIDQLKLNCAFLRQHIDAIHACLCPGQHGTWQQRAEQASRAARKFGPMMKAATGG